MVTRKSKRGTYDIEQLDDIELPAEIEAKVKHMTDCAETEIAAAKVSLSLEKQQHD